MNSKATAETVSAEHLALGPLDGRYSQIGRKLAPYFSEYALVRNRVKVEVMWLKFLLENVNGSDILDAFDMNRLPEILDIYVRDYVLDGGDHFVSLDQIAFAYGRIDQGHDADVIQREQPFLEGFEAPCGIDSANQGAHGTA